MIHKIKNAKIKFEEDISKEFIKYPDPEKDEDFKEFKESYEKEDLREDEKFPDITKDLKEIQKSSVSKKETTDFVFKFENFVKNCLKVEIEEENLKYIKIQIEDTLNLLDESNLNKANLYLFYQIKIVWRFYNQLLENIGAVKVENEGKYFTYNKWYKTNYIKI